MYQSESERYSTSDPAYNNVANSYVSNYSMGTPPPPPLKRLAVGFVMKVAWINGISVTSYYYN